MTKEKVIYRPKAVWQKNDCIRPACTKKSTIEAVYGKAMIRCCTNEECKSYASEIAISQG